MTDILMSTYNGERYLPEQLDSIINQTEQDWHLYVRDDGSSDNTLQVLADYAAKDARITITDNGGQNLGVIRSFESLLQQWGNDEYIMFCDQDDVWLPNKAALTLEHMKAQEAQAGKDIPIVVHTDLLVVDEDMQEMAPSFWRYSNIVPEILNHNVHYLGICNSITGCAMMMNQAARKVVLPFAKQAFMHDQWIGISVLQHHGILHAVYEPTMKYRQHHSNVVGAEEYHFTLKDLSYKWYLAKRTYRAAHGIVFRNVLHFLYWKTIYFFALHTHKDS